ncbi:MAG: sodium-dependent transporter [Synergistaceae bacterium]|nr:sodium-dependent transporter [Synergistaceae bacterium]
MEQKREQWGSRFGFLMASAGSAIGLGSIWRFPYVAGVNGGACFLISYLIMCFTLGASLNLAEWSIGRAAKSDVVGSFTKLGGKKWGIVGFGALISCFIIAAYYSILSGVVLYYIKFSLVDLARVSKAGYFEAVFNTITSIPRISISLHALNMFIVIAIISKGVSGGIEKMCKYVMPWLFIILLILIARALTLPGAIAGLKFYLLPDFKKFGARGLLEATGQSFYSLSLAMGIAVTYGSYMKKDDKMVPLNGTVVFLTTFVAFLAGLVIFPACVAMGVKPTAGVGLCFITLPEVFCRMACGPFFATAFFILFYIAAVTSSVAILEVLVAYGMGQLKMSRKTSTQIMGLVVFLLGIPVALSGMPNFPKIFGRTIFEASDFLVNNWILPLVAIFTCIFVGWVWQKGAKNELTNGGRVPFKFYPVWSVICKFIAPVILAILLIHGGKW